MVIFFSNSLFLWTLNQFIIARNGPLISSYGSYMPPNDTCLMSLSSHKIMLSLSFNERKEEGRSKFTYLNFLCSIVPVSCPNDIMYLFHLICLICLIIRRCGITLLLSSFCEPWGHSCLIWPSIQSWFITNLKIEFYSFLADGASKTFQIVRWSWSRLCFDKGSWHSILSLGISHYYCLHHPLDCERRIGIFMKTGRN